METRHKLDEMNTLWETALAKTRDRQIELDDSLREAKSFHDDLQDMLVRLSEIDGQMITAKPVGGLPETARDQLEKFTVSVFFMMRIGFTGSLLENLTLCLLS